MNASMSHVTVKSPSIRGKAILEQSSTALKRMQRN
jgi:hypothetical protein